MSIDNLLLDDCKELDNVLQDYINNENNPESRLLYAFLKDKPSEDIDVDKQIQPSTADKRGQLIYPRDITHVDVMLDVYAIAIIFTVSVFILIFYRGKSYY